MISPALPPIANHLWQSTICVVLAWLLTLALRKNRAAVRYCLWLAASVKFLIPFSMLVSVGHEVEWRTDRAAGHAQISSVVNQLSRPFAPPAPIITTPASAQDLSLILLTLWLIGFVVALASWGRWWRRMRAIRRTASPLHLNLPIPVMSSPARLEPGVFGIRNPILLLPEGITDRLTPRQLQAVIAHELCHIRRRDNLTAAVHMAVEAIFWFHPLMWWLRARLIEERERACDEAVLTAANDPHIYAEGILNVCKFYLESPLICASGVTGADLKKRIEKIIDYTAARKLDWTRRSLLAFAATLTLGGPIAIGAWYAPPVQAQSQSAAALPTSFEVASIKVNRTGELNSGFRRFTGGELNTVNITLKMLIAFAYDIPNDQILGGPNWLDTEKYDILAKPDRSSGAANQSISLIRKHTQALLADRFGLTLHKETRQLPVFELVLTKNGPMHLRPPTKTEPDLITNGHQVTCWRVSMEYFAKVFLTPQVGRPVTDKTGIKGDFDFTMEWTPDESPKEPNPLDLTGPTLFAALQEQLGLKLESAKGPVEVQIVDHATHPPEN